MSPADIAFAVLVVVVLAVLGVRSLGRTRARREAVARLAAARGWTPAEDQASELAGDLRGSHLARHGGSLRNVQRTRGDGGAFLFDYEYTVGASGRRRRVRQSVAAFRTDDGGDWCLRPKEPAGLLDTILGRGTPSPTGHAGLDGRYDLFVPAGVDRPVFDPALADRLAAVRECPTIERVGRWLIVYRRNRIVDAPGLPAFADEAAAWAAACV